MINIDAFKEHFDNMLNPSFSFWSANKMAKKMKRNPLLKHFETKSIERKFDELDAWNRHKILTKRAVDKYSRKIEVSNIGYFQIDFADFTNFNDTHKYLLIIIDVYSRFLIVYPCKSREAFECAQTT